MAPRPTSRPWIEEQNRLLLDCYRHFRVATDAVTAAWRSHPHVLAVSLIGSAATTSGLRLPEAGESG